MMNPLNIPDEYVISRGDGEIAYSFNFTVFEFKDKVRFQVDDIKTSWMGIDDFFIARIQFERLNRCFLEKHLRREIEIRNVIDEGISYLEAERYPKAIKCFDEAICYDDAYAEALLLKSRALFKQSHYVKALRHYRKAVMVDNNLRDVDYHKLLLKKSNEERDNFPPIKRNIYAGDEHFARGEYEDAFESYDKALSSPSSFKSKIISKLLNKKASTLIKLKRYGDALDCFNESLNVKDTDCARFGSGLCRYHLGLELNDSFLGELKIPRRLKLKRALILDDIKMHDESIKCIDDMMKSHFFVDDLYLTALSQKITILNGLNLDASACEKVFKTLKKDYYT